MAWNSRARWVLPTALLLTCATGLGLGSSAPGGAASAAADPGTDGRSRTGITAEPAEHREPEIRLQPMADSGETERSRALLAARSSGRAGAATLSLARPGNGAALAPLQDGAVEIYSDAAVGCTRLEGVTPPTLDCSVLAGGSLAQRFRALAVGGAAASSDLVGITATSALPGLSLTRLDAAGQPLPGPVEAPGQVNARLDFAPAVGQETAIGSPLELEIQAWREDAAGVTTGVALLRLRLHVLPAGSSHAVGFVFNDRDGDGQRDIDEPGLPGWALGLSGATQASDTSDAHGRFALIGLAAGAYDLTLGDRSGWVPTRPGRVSFKTDGGAAGQIVELQFGVREGRSQLALGARLQTDRGCGTAVYEPGEPLQVYLEASGLAEAEVTLERTDANGRVERLLERRRVPGAQTFAFEIGAGDATGKAELRLSVFEPGAPVAGASASCAYRVQAAEGARIGYSPLSLDFGAVGLGGDATGQVLLRNDGLSDLVLSSLAIQGGPGSAFQIATIGLDGMRLAPGQSMPLAVRFAPGSAGSHQDFLLLRCNDTGQPLVSIPLHGSTQNGGQAAGGYVRADRGCLETQDSPLYFVGDPIELRMRLDSQIVSEAAARIEDVTPDGQTRVIFSRNVAVNQDLTLGGARIIPPVGIEALRLTAQVGYEIVRNECSFRVAAGGTRIVGYKFEDLNGNGIWEGCPSTPWIPGNEPAIPGWGVTLTGPESYSTVTDASGRFELVVSSPGSYSVTEEQRAGWSPTRAPSVALNIQCFPGEAPAEIYFGNRQTGACQPGKDPCWPSPTPPYPTPPSWPTPTPASGTATAAIPSPTPVDNPTLPPPGTPPPPPPPPVCAVQIAPRPSLQNVGERAQFSATVNGGGQVLGYQWSVSGDVIRDYSELTRQSWSVTPMLASDYQAPSISFYWKPEVNQQHPQNAGPQARTVSVTVTTAQGECSTSHVLNVERNNTSLSRQAEDWYTGNHSTAVLTEHTLWHAQYPFSGWSYDGTLFFDFHRQFLNRFNSWRSEFGYPPLGIWDSGTSLPRGIDVDHAARGATYVPQPKPSWFTLNGLVGRPGNGLPCDLSRGGERNLRDYPANRRLLGCTATHPWHNSVHTAIGGDMLNPQFSPRDPIFWRWHSFVDVVSQERMGVFAAALLDRLDPNDQRMPSLPNGLDGQDSPPHVVYQVPFRLYRFLDGLERFEVEFDQAVSGVRAEDLTINGVPARTLTRESNQRYVFSGFPAPDLGRLEVKLAPGGIKNVYNVGYAGDSWRYFVVDPSIDEDRDGLLSREELDVTLTSPIDRDSDEDGLSDGDEVRLYGTRPLMWDSDLDGANDRCEIEKGSDPRDPADTARGCPISSIFVCFAGNGTPDR
ncbi:MAG: tyrosinase family protein [Chloroflexi bacterium]|nr:tyrosinase family protein [Chloroflexota bacterium]